MEQILMMMKWRIKGMKNIHNLRGLGLKIWRWKMLISIKIFVNV
jgi:hypothetical protein